MRLRKLGDYAKHHSTGGNQSEAARRLGVSRVTLIDKMKKYHLGTKR